MGVTIYDLAREAGVGIGTVSRCLNNHPSVSPKTRERVLSVVKRLSYQPHANAQRLATKRTNSISTIIPFFTNHFFVEVLRGVQDRSQELGIDLILYGVSNPDQVEYYLRRSLSRGRVDGVMFFSMGFPETFVERFEQIGLPIVLVDTYHKGFDSITVRNREGAEIAVDHLCRLGHRRIAMINGFLETRPGRERFDGYKRALLKNGIEIDPGLIYSSGRVELDGSSRETGRLLMHRLMTRLRSDQVTAVFVASDIQALGVLEAARVEGVRIPEDIALVSFDDIELAKHAELTTMRQPMYEMGSLALDWLVTGMNRKRTGARTTTFLPELVVRNSCGSRVKENLLTTVRDNIGH